MRDYDELIYKLIFHSDYGLTKEELIFLNEASVKVGAYDKYKQLEEELGCPLDIVVKALTNGIYQEDGGRRKYPLIAYNSATKKFFFNFGTYCDVEDYKKTWWLREDKSE